MKKNGNAVPDCQSVVKGGGTRVDRSGSSGRGGREWRRPCASCGPLRPLGSTPSTLSTLSTNVASPDDVYNLHIFCSYISCCPMGRPPKEPPDGESLIPPHGGYRNLKSFQMAELCFDVTVRFCKRYVDRRSRTHDQMVQAARSGTQNIVEGSAASGTSKRTEMKLTDTARFSLEELRRDFRDYLRQRGLKEWS